MGKFKRNCKKVPTETVKDPIAKMMKEMLADIKEIKKDLKSNNAKIDELSEKVENLENKNKVSKEKNEKTFKEIKGKISKVEVRVTNKIMSEIEPSLNIMKGEIQTLIGADIRRLVQEEVAIQRLREAKEQEDAASDPEEPEKIKNIKIQKKIKSKIPKKIWIQMKSLMNVQEVMKTLRRKMN